MQDNLLEQVQAEPEYNFTNISGKVNGSEFEGKILAKIAGVTELPATLEDTAFWMQHAVVDSKMTMQREAALFIAGEMVKAQLAGNPQVAAMSLEEQAQLIAQQAEATLTGMAQQGMITVSEDGYEVVFTMQNAEAMLNGNPIPL
jgi:uncharacterized protein YdgA (DUF945 family)